MDNQQTASRFDWIQWLATIPGVPSDWGMACPANQQAAPLPDPDDWPMLEAA